ncbi:MAG: hypothetical protein RBR93_08590 [Aliarcobacter butzleri]|nr:hypothetical protein [Aliarcobacter butzleri]
MELVNANTVVVNGQTVAVVDKPKYKRGVPKVDVKTATIGDKVLVYENVDYSEATGAVVIKIQPTAENIEMLESWQDNIGKNAIRMVDSRTGFTKTFNNMSIMEDIEIDFSVEIEVTFTGGQGI